MGVGAFSLFFVPALYALGGSNNHDDRVMLGIFTGLGAATGLLARRATQHVLLSETGIPKFESLVQHPFGSSVDMAFRISWRVYIHASILTFIGFYAMIHLPQWYEISSTRYSPLEPWKEKRERGSSYDVAELEKKRAYWMEVADENSELKHKIRKEKHQYEISGPDSEWVPNLETDEAMIAYEELLKKEGEAQQNIKDANAHILSINSEIKLAHITQTYSLWWHFGPTHWGQYIGLVALFYGTSHFCFFL